MGARSILGGLLIAVTGCPDDDPAFDDPVPVAVVRADAWVRVVDVAADVFGASRPDDVTCDELMGYGLEDFGPDRVFEIKTDLCDFFTGTQPSLVALAPGDTVAIRVWHYELTAPAPTEGYVALAIGGTIAWEQTVPIPGPSALLEGEVAIDRELPAGTELQFHVHNHGVNAWAVLAIEARREDGP